MQPGTSIRRKAITGEAQTERLIDRTIEGFRRSFDGSEEELKRLVRMGRVARVNYALPPRNLGENLNAVQEDGSPIEGVSDDRLSIVWQEDTPVIVALETRDAHNFVDTVIAYPGPVRHR